MRMMLKQHKSSELPRMCWARPSTALQGPDALTGQNSVQGPLLIWSPQGKSQLYKKQGQ